MIFGTTKGRGRRRGGKGEGSVRVKGRRQGEVTRVRRREGPSSSDSREVRPLFVVASLREASRTPSPSPSRLFSPSTQGRDDRFPEKGSYVCRFSGKGYSSVSAEMVRRQALFLGDSELQQLLHIFRRGSTSTKHLLKDTC
ncbi:uncharacterized protein LOC131249375 isoform X9 [Magnolia sinica]|uniref:uncharacterized protein LOC131249375 isoform X9 n=1 Tax=Magnolia sinica TaxID=86752 RepID=UPI002659F633|nr:uncharacterized protein LOC131249375 isoform X9 [Magnolia sinica]